MSEIPKRPTRSSLPGIDYGFIVDQYNHERAVTAALWEAISELDASDPSCLTSEGRAYIAGIMKRVTDSGWTP
jgi:hypothetical protein